MHLPSLRDGPHCFISYNTLNAITKTIRANLKATAPLNPPKDRAQRQHQSRNPPLKSDAAPGRRPGVVPLLIMDVVTRFFIAVSGAVVRFEYTLISVPEGR